jgi:hypothetical protein
VEVFESDRELMRISPGWMQLSTFDEDGVNERNEL